MRIIKKCKLFTVCMVIIFICLLASHAPQAQLILKEYSPPPTLEFANLDSQIRGELYKALKNVLDVELVRAKKEGRYEDVLFNYLYVLLKQLDPKQKDKNLQETDIVRKNALSEDHELFISFAGGIAGAGVQFLTGIPAPFLGEGAKLLGFKLGEYMVLRDISSATVEYARIGRIEIVYVRSKNRVFVNVRLDEPVCKEVFILVPIELKPMKTSWGTYVCPPTWAGLTCPPEAALKEIVPKLEDVKMMQSPRKDRVCAIQSSVQPSITSSLQITPKKEKYQVGDVLTAEFNIANNGNASITFDTLTVGGRVNDICPQDKCPDFDWKRDITLKPNETYHYNGKLKVKIAGDYHFFTAYRTKDGQWNTAIPIAPGVTNIKDIVVEVPDIFKVEDIPRTKGVPFGKIAFVSDRDGNLEIYVMEKTSDNIIRLTRNLANDYSPAWSPDGTKIAFVSDRSGKPDIYIMNSDGSNVKRITQTGTASYPVWLPDGMNIAFGFADITPGAYCEVGGFVALVGIDGQNYRNLANHSGFVGGGPGVSPDSKQIAYMVGTLRGSTLRLIDITGKILREYLFFFNGLSFNPTWSPDGKWIAFYSRPNNGIFLVDPSNGNIRQLTKKGRNPSWSPDGKWIIFASGEGGWWERGILKEGSSDLQIVHVDGKTIWEITQGDRRWDPNWLAPFKAIITP